MKDKQHFKALITEALALIAARQFSEARAMLQEIAADPEVKSLGQITALGLPRKLHSAWLKLAKAEADPVVRSGYQYHLVPPPKLLAPYGRFDRAERIARTAVDRLPAPRVIHQIWIGPKPVPVTCQAWATYAKIQGYDYRLWREEDLATIEIDRNPVFAAMLAAGDFPGAVDVARYVILHRLGGIYLDCDWYPARTDMSFHERLPMAGLTALAEDIPRLTGMGSTLLGNAFIAAPPHHPVFERMLQAIPKIWQDMPEAPAWWSTGPLLFTIVARSGSVSLADAEIVAGQAEPRASLSKVAQMAMHIERHDGGILLAWKPW